MKGNGFYRSVQIFLGMSDRNKRRLKLRWQEIYALFKH